MLIDEEIKRRLRVGPTLSIDCSPEIPQLGESRVRELPKVRRVDLRVALNGRSRSGWSDS